MINRHLSFCVKNKASIFVVILFVIYGILLVLIPDFALWTSSTNGNIYEPMKSFYSLHSVLSMTFIFLPVYLLWIYSMKYKQILEVIRYKTFEKYISHIVINTLIEALIFELVIFLTLILSSLKYIMQIKWNEVAIESINALLGFWVIGLIVELLITIFYEKPYIPIILSFLILICEYLFYYRFNISFITYPLLAADTNKNMYTFFLYMIYAVVIILILYNVISAVHEKKSLY